MHFESMSLFCIPSRGDYPRRRECTTLLHLETEAMIRHPLLALPSFHALVTWPFSPRMRRYETSWRVVAGGPTEGRMALCIAKQCTSPQKDNITITSWFFAPRLYGIGALVYSWPCNRRHCSGCIRCRKMQCNESDEMDVWV